MAYYVFDDAKNLFEGMTREQIVNAIANATGLTPEQIDADVITSAIKEQNAQKSVNLWIGTQNEYNAIATPDENTLYVVTDPHETNELQSQINQLQSEVDNIVAASTTNATGFVIQKLESDPLELEYNSTYQDYEAQNYFNVPEGAEILEYFWIDTSFPYAKNTSNLFVTRETENLIRLRYRSQTQESGTFILSLVISYPQPITLPELTDIRVGADGTVYDTAGAAVRAQAVQIDDTLTQSGKAADAKATGDELSSLNNTIYGLKTTGSYTEKSWASYGTLQVGRTATAYPATNLISEASNSSYDSYYIVVNKETKLYVDASNINYYALCVGANASGDWYEGASNTLLHACDSPYRVRKSDHNLPSVENPIIVPEGGIIVATVTAGTSPSVFIYEENEEKSVKIAKTYCKKEESIVVINGDNYKIKFEKKNTTQGYQWNITSLAGKGANMFPAGVDIIGVIQFVGGSNFMGGVHGNESNYEFRVMENGDDIVGEGYYDEIHIIMNSHLYDPDNNTNNVVDRFVEFVFNKNGWTCRNTFKILVNAEIQVAYCSGLFAFTASDCNGAYSNIGTVDLSSTTARQLQSEQFKEITINLPESFTVNICSETADIGWVTYRSNTQSFKVYFANAQLENVQANTYITGKCEYRF